MSGPIPFIAMIDFEMTALSIEADVIEVGVAIYDRQETIMTWSSLVRPSPDCRWNERSAQVHKIPRAEADAAPEPSWVAAELNRIMAGVPTAYCDAYPFDSVWMGNLFHDAKVEPTFAIAPIEEMPRMHLQVVRHHMTAYLNRTMIPHRAGEDALRLMQAYLYAIGKKAHVVAVGNSLRQPDLGADSDLQHKREATRARTAPIIATIDFEASSLAIQGEPIEVGIALWERRGPIRTWSSLIYPANDILWSPESAEVHGITRDELLRAPHPARVVERLNARMAASPIAFCDGGQSDERWMWQLYSAGHLDPVFRLMPIESMPGLHVEAVRNRMWTSLETTTPPHRAGPDAVRLMRAYANALGETPDVEEF